MKTIENYINNAYQTHFSQSQNSVFNSAQIREDLAGQQHHADFINHFDLSKSVFADLMEVQA